jgi:transposase
MVVLSKRTLIYKCVGLRPETDDLLDLTDEPDRLLLAAGKTSLRDLARH